MTLSLNISAALRNAYKRLSSILWGEPLVWLNLSSAEQTENKAILEEERTRLKLRAEALRDIGILLLVFAPLESWLKSNSHTITDWCFGFAGLIAGVLILSYGISEGARYDV